MRCACANRWTSSCKSSPSCSSCWLRRSQTYAETPIIAFTHLQPAEPSTLGYRLAFYAQDLLADWKS